MSLYLEKVTHVIIPGVGHTSLCSVSVAAVITMTVNFNQYSLNNAAVRMEMLPVEMTPLV